MKIGEGFGPDGLGILSISNVPGYTSLRQNLLNIAPKLAKLPEKVKKELEDPQSSHGKEKLESGKPSKSLNMTRSAKRFVLCDIRRTYY
ncbi:hypothetical protein L1887_05417 [Cichorium endivia]|nr:hypothetical protein L1887_05417 [Cichorium endivia]